MKKALLLVLALIPAMVLADIDSGEITNVHVSATSTGATVTWTTKHASSSWVFLNWNGMSGMPARRVGQDDSVTSHSVAVTGLQPYNAASAGQNGGPNGKYQYYVASKQNNGTWSSFGGPSTNAYETILTFQTTALDTNAPLDWQIQPYGQKNVYAGHDLWMTPATQLLAGTGGKVGVLTTSEVRRVRDNTVVPTISIHTLQPKSYPGGFNPGAKFDGNIFRWKSHDYYYGGTQHDNTSGPWAMGANGFFLRIRVAADTPPGDYVAHITIQLYTNDSFVASIGSPKSVTWPFHVYPPAKFTATPPATFPAIPQISVWKSRMTSNARGGGEYWCTEAETANPAAGVDYGPFLGPPYAMVGFNFNYFQPFNYDGGRVYQQIADYDYSTPGMPGYQSSKAREHWRHCAQAILAPYDNWIIRTLGKGLQEPNQFLTGTAMYYLRTGDPSADKALANATDTNGSFMGIFGTAQTMDARTFAYTWMSQIANEVAGRKPWQLAWMATDSAIGLLDQFQQTNCTDVQSTWNYHNFQLGILMEAMIQQYELDVEKSRTPDARIPIEIGKALNYLFNNFYNADLGTTRYNFCDVPMPHAWSSNNSSDVWAALNMLVAPAAAWYWSKTGDESIRGYADALFAATWNDTGNLTWGPKEFNQVYKWSFDYVHWRSEPNAKPTFLPSQNPQEGIWPDTAPPLIVHEFPYAGGFWQDAALVAPTVAATSATFAWDTTENATTEIYYKAGTVDSCNMKPGSYQASVDKCLSQYPKHSAVDPGGVRHHTANIMSLMPKTTYHYRLYSRDAAGNGTMTPDATFTTGIAAP